MKDTHGLRTTGTHTGNFGRAKVQGRPGTVDLSTTTLQKDGLVIPDRDAAFAKLEEAFRLSQDPKQRAALWEILRQRKATLNQSKPRKNERPRSEYWDLVRATR